MNKVHFKITLVFEGTMPEADQTKIMDSIGNIGEEKEIIQIIKTNITEKNTTFKINTLSWVKE